MDNTIVITVQEYDRLLEKERKLGALEQMGVDNWEGYPLAMDLLSDDEEEEE